MKSKERQQALTLLTRLFKEKTPLSASIQADTLPKAREIVYGVVRHYEALQATAQGLMKKKPKELPVELAILMGIYQLQFMKQPDYAVVQETVSLLQAPSLRWARGLVNAVLRQFIQQKEQFLANTSNCNPAPQWLCNLLQNDWPGQWQAILQANLQHPPMSLRVNRSKLSVSDYQQLLTEQGQTGHTHPYAPDCLILEKPCPVEELPGFGEGLVSVQDAAAQLACSLLDLQPGLNVLDACSAPGGKTCHILEHQPGLKRLLALDNDEKRLARVQDNLTRLHLRAELQCADALDPKSWWDGDYFDRILLDAPCSALGVIRRHPDIKLLRSPEDLQAVTVLQKNLLEALWPLLAPQGLLVYATCSITRQENENQIAAFLSQHPEAEISNPNLPFPSHSALGQQILPGDVQMDGFFYCVLKKRS